MYERKGMDQSSMPGMNHVTMSTMPMPAKPAASATPADDMSGLDHSSMPDVSPQAMPGMDHRAIPEKGQGDMAGMVAMPSMGMGPMQGGSAPADRAEEHTYEIQ